ncbi:MAG: EboA domain-containing protein [Methyloligella sp. ZOD6]
MTDQDRNDRHVSLLRGWLQSRLDAEQNAWLDERIDRVKSANSIAQLGMAVGLVPRKLGKADLALSDSEYAEAQELRAGLDPSGWSIDQTARILLILTSFQGDEDAFAEGLNKLFATGEIGEHIAILRGLPLYPAADRLVPLAGEGLRSNMQPVYEAVAHQSPYPAEAFDQNRWNHMVLKALFIDSRLAPIQQLDERRNQELAEMLIDYAHERWAAGRRILPELWRCVGPYARPGDIADLEKVLREGDETERKAAALALSESPLPEAAEALKTAPDLAEKIRAGETTWQDIA